MDALYVQTNELVREIGQCFEKLSQPKGESEDMDVEKEIQMKITTANSNCDRMDVLMYKIPAGSQRQVSKMRVDQLKYDLRHLQSSLRLYRDRRKAVQTELMEREQLLSHRFTANSTADAPETRLDMSLQHHTQLGNANQGVDDMISTGSNILSSLINQRDTLKGAHRRILNIGSTLGLSNHTMKLIERRFSEDKWVMLGGMAVTLLVIGLVIYYVVF